MFVSGVKTKKMATATSKNGKELAAFHFLRRKIIDLEEKKFYKQLGKMAGNLRNLGKRRHHSNEYHKGM